MKYISLFLLGTTLTGASFGAGQLSRVTVKGNQFVTAEGNPIVFRGLNASGPGKKSGEHQWNKRYFESVRSWGATIMRFPGAPLRMWRGPRARGIPQASRSGHWLGQGIGAVQSSSIGTASGELAEEKYHRGEYQTTRAETNQFWRTMARHYSGNNTVAFFELFNEPALGTKLGDCPWLKNGNK